jgi:cytochrome c peroxidase
VAAVMLASARTSASDVRIILNPEWAGRAVAVPSPTELNRTGQQVRITRVSALLSGFALRRPDGAAVALPNQYAWIDGASGRLSTVLTGVEDGAYTGLEFTIGLPQAVDAGDANRWPAGHPLDPLTNGMYWGWQGGYVFAAIEGQWWQTGGPRRGFSFHLAEGAGSMQAQVAVPFLVKGSTVVRCAWDLAAILRPLEFEADGKGSSTHSRANDPLAGWLARAVVRAVGWRGASEDDLVEASKFRPGPQAMNSSFIVPWGFPQPRLPADNPITSAGVELGKALFFDPRLSGNGTQSCVSCHRPQHGFADPAAQSVGATGAHGARHSPSLFNLAWQPAYAWDGSKPLIRDQVRVAITSPTEMSGHLSRAVERLSADPVAAGRFQKAFGAGAVTAEKIERALEQYVLTLVSADSKFDRAARGQAALLPLEKRGLELFVTEFDPAHGRHGADCFHCHGGALFGDYAYRDNGLGWGVREIAGAGAVRDRGRAVVTGNADDDGKFKTPSLRGVAQRAPYMHDGRLPNLEAVVAYYANGVNRTPNLDPNLGKHPDSGIDLSPEDQAALVAFLKTL